MAWVVWESFRNVKLTVPLENKIEEGPLRISEHRGKYRSIWQESGWILEDCCVLQRIWNLSSNLKPIRQSPSQIQSIKLDWIRVFSVIVKFQIWITITNLDCSHQLAVELKYGFDILNFLYIIKETWEIETFHDVSIFRAENDIHITQPVPRDRTLFCNSKP